MQTAAVDYRLVADVYATKLERPLVTRCKRRRAALSLSMVLLRQSIAIVNLVNAMGLKPLRLGDHAPQSSKKL